MDAKLGLFGLLGFFVFIVLAVISAIRKNGRVKKVLIGIGLSFALLVTGCAVSPDSSRSTDGSKSSNSEVSQNADENTGGNGSTIIQNSSSALSPSDSSESASKESTSQEAPAPSGKLKVHFIDVGQADSILIQDGNVNMLIDAGNNADANTVVDYIKKQGIKRLDYVVGTHPHEDHIGGLDAVINSFDIGKIYMPKVSNTTKTYTDVLNAIKAKGLKVTTPQAGSSFRLNTANATILAPNGSSYEDLNNYSIVIRLTFGRNSFLFEGDAEDVSESQMISRGYTLSADVLKVGHHGSNSSTSTAFLNKVNPKYAVIMVGKDNTYGHPHEGTMDKLKSRGIKVYRTDENGTIIATSDGSNISFNVNPGSYSYRGNGAGGTSSSTSSSSTKTAVTPSSSVTSVSSGKMYVDASGRGLIKGNINSKGEKIYHLPGGAYYDRTNPEAWFKTEADAKAAGYRPSSR